MLLFVWLLVFDKNNWFGFRCQLLQPEYFWVSNSLNKRLWCESKQFINLRNFCRGKKVWLMKRVVKSEYQFFRWWSGWLESNGLRWDDELRWCALVIQNQCKILNWIWGCRLVCCWQQTNNRRWLVYYYCLLCISANLALEQV